MSTELGASWVREVADFLEQCVGANESEAPELLRSLHSICRRGPASVCNTYAAKDLSEAEIAGLIACGAFESLAMRMIRPHGYMLSASPSGMHVATLSSPAVGECTFDAQSAAIAFAGAAATALYRAARTDPRRNTLEGTPNP